MMMTEMETFDVLVAGAGTAGCVSATQAGRLGAKTLLIEKNGMPGGTMTVGGIAFPGLFYAWGKQVIGGIGWELVTAAVREAGSTLPDFASQEGMACHPRYQVRLNPLLYAATCDTALRAAGVHVLFHAMIGAAEADAEGWIVTLCTKTGLRKVRARALVDATGDATLATLAGCGVTYPETCQPATLCCRLGGYDFAALDLESIGRAADAAVAAGELRYNDLGWKYAAFSPQLLKTYGDNANHLECRGAETSEGRTALEIAGRESLLRAWRFLRRQPGLENIRIDAMFPECGVRETAVIQGKYTISGEDYITGRDYPDPVSYAFYPIDLHDHREGIIPQRLQEGTFPKVPLRALLPQGVGRFVATGRIVSSDRNANSALRVQGTCMGTGQAAGAAAALLATGKPLDYAVLRRTLLTHGAILPEAVGK